MTHNTLYLRKGIYNFPLHLFSMTSFTSTTSYNTDPKRQRQEGSSLGGSWALCCRGVGVLKESVSCLSTSRPLATAHWLVGPKKRSGQFIPSCSFLDEFCPFLRYPMKHNSLLKDFNEYDISCTLMRCNGKTSITIFQLRNIFYWETYHECKVSAPFLSL